MAGSHPYISGPGNIAQMIAQLRKSFPQTISSDTVKRLGLAPNNESYVINALQFVGVIDSEGKKTTEASKVFSHHKDDEFAQAFSGLVKKAYFALFDLHGEDAWDLESEDLITFFRQADQTSDAIGKRQSATFKIFAGVCGHAELPAAKNGGKTGAKNQKSTSKKAPKKQNKANQPSSTIIQPSVTNNGNRDIGLTVRVEINLPADATKETYDNIFKSIKENLIDAS